MHLIAGTFFLFVSISTISYAVNKTVYEITIFGEGNTVRRHPSLCRVVYA